MSDDFEIYQVDSLLSRDRQTVLSALKKAMRTCHSNAMIGWTPAGPRDPECHLFLKGKEGVAWGRVFFEKLTHVDLDTLFKEGEVLFRDLNEMIFTYVFFPLSARGVLESLPARLEEGYASGAYKRIRFFEYSFLRSQNKEGLALRDWTPSVVRSKYDQVPPTGEARKDLLGSDPESAHFFKAARLKKQELGKLFQMVSDYQKR